MRQKLLLPCCLGLLLTSTLLAGKASDATSKEASLSCGEEHASASQAAGQAADRKDSAAVSTDSSRPLSIKLTWSPSASPKSAVAGYNIFRCDMGPDCYKNHSNFKQLNPLHSPIIGVTCTDYDVLSGHTYIYEAQTVGTNTKVSTMSNQAKAVAR